MTAYHPDHTLPARVPFRRLALVETRKLVDTRSGKILVAIVPVLALAAMVARAVTSPIDLDTLIGTAGIGYVLLPVIAILSLTGEWSHRTALTTFALEPRRLRVLAAKSVPIAGAGVAATVFAVLAAVPVAAVTGSAWDFTPLALLGLTVTNVINLCQGAALGLLLLNAPAAIVIYLLWPMVLAFAAQTGQVESVLSWINLGTTQIPLLDGGWSGLKIAQLAVSLLVWVVLPAAFGALRVLRKEVS